MSPRAGLLSPGATDIAGREGGGPVRRVVGGLAASLASTPAAVRTRSGSRHGHMSPGGKTLLLRTTDPGTPKGRGEDWGLLSLRQVLKKESLGQPWRLELALILSPHLGGNRAFSAAAKRTPAPGKRQKAAAGGLGASDPPCQNTCTVGLWSPRTRGS